MKVLFLKHVLHVAKQWEIKEVKSGYAANCLFPQWLAVELTPEQEKKHKNSLKKEDSRRRELIENRHQLSEQLQWKKLNFTLKTWTNGRVFWWIGEKDIIECVKKEFQIELSKKHIDLPDGHIKKLWETFIYITLWKDAMAKMTAHVVSE